jgi:phage terminase small subunit
MNTQQAKFVDSLTKGNNITDSAKIAGYNQDYASRLISKSKIKEALHKAGLTDSVLANTIKTNIESGVGVKATADTATKNVELALRLKGYLDKPDNQTLNQVNVQINEYKQLSNDELQAEIEATNSEISELKTSPDAI